MGFRQAISLAAVLAASTTWAAKADFLDPLYKLCAGLMATQNSAGALVCPSTNPDRNKLHSRVGEAAYPLAVAFKHSQDAKYADAAIKLGNWLISTQDGGGFWSEDWPAAGWNGTTADQLISLAGAYVVLKARLGADDAKWKASITKAANYIQANFPMGNINYQPTGAVALKMAHEAVGGPAGWLTKADQLMAVIINDINSDKLITGEGEGIDLGYNIAQSIGFITLYGLLTNKSAHVDQGVQLLNAHYRFMYPNGAIDNSWGTRSYKWMLESGSKTAPGVPFTFALLADKDPKFNRAAQLAVQFLSRHFIDDKNLLVYGPHAVKHASSNPPCLYPSFARAQSLAMAVEYGPETGATAPIPAETKNWSAYYPTAKTGVIRTDKIMATVTAYDGIGRYPRGTVVRGGSLSAVWFEGYGPTGFLQASSQTDYSREEPRHMPDEGSSLLPLTPRIVRNDGASNLYDEKATVAIAEEAGAGYKATATGVLRTSSGAAAGVNFTWIHRIAANAIHQEVTVSSGANLQIIEPFVNNPGNQYALVGDSLFRITTQSGGIWELRVTSSSGPYTLVSGENAVRYWAPFPGLEAHPLTIKLSGSGSQTLKYSISQSTPNRLAESSLKPLSELTWRMLPGARLFYQYRLPQPARISLNLSSLEGRRVLTLESGLSQAGSRSLETGMLPAGVYLLNLNVDGKPAARESVRLP